MWRRFWEPCRDWDHDERPYLEAPSPLDYYRPQEPPSKDEDEDADDAPRVIIIEI